MLTIDVEGAEHLILGGGTGALPAPLPTYIKSQQKSRAPPPRAVVPMAKPGGLGSTSARRLRTSYG